MPKIGLRTVKTMLAVMFTMVFHLVLYIISPDFAETWYSPFFAGIAAVYSLQKENANSFARARIRSLGSLFGGLFGMLLVLIYESIGMDYILTEFGYTIHLAVLYALTTIFVIVLIYLLIVFKQNDLIFVAALTYLSVTISQRNNLPVFNFAINRISSTIIGVMIALGINQIRFIFQRNKDILFVSALDSCLLNSNKELSSFTQYQLTNLLEDGLNFTVSTTRTPASLVKIFKDVPLSLEMMIMNGAVIYDMNKEKYTDIISIPIKTHQEISDYFKTINRNIFTYTIVDQALSIYHLSFENEAEEKFYHDRKNDYFRNHIKGSLQGHEDVVYYILIDKKDKIDQIVSDLKGLKHANDFTTNVYPYDYFEGYYHLKINAATSSKKKALESFLQKHHEKYVVSFGSKSYDIEMMKASNFSIALANADEEVKMIADLVLDSTSSDLIAKEIKHIYYSKKPFEYLKRKKETQSASLNH